MTVDVDLDKHERGLDSRLISETGGFQLNIWEIRMGMNCWIKYQVCVSMYATNGCYLYKHTNIIVITMIKHDDGIKWNIFRATGHLWPVTGEFPAQRPVTRGFDIFCDLRLNKWFSKQSWGWWFKTPLCSLWRHSNGQCFINSTSIKDDRSVSLAHSMNATYVPYCNSLLCTVSLFIFSLILHK